MKIIRTEVEEKRAAWWAEHFQPGMSSSEALQLNEELLDVFPMTDEEREERKKDMEGMPEFVL